MAKKYLFLKKLFIVPSNERNANHNNFEIWPYPSRCPRSTKTTDSKHWRGCGEREPSFTVSGL